MANTIAKGKLGLISFGKVRLKDEIRNMEVKSKFFEKNESVRDQYKAAIRELLVGDHPENVDVKRIKGKRNDYFRIKLGKWRVVYTIIKDQIVVVSTLYAGARGDIYKKSLSNLK